MADRETAEALFEEHRHAFVWLILGRHFKRFPSAKREKDLYHNSALIGLWEAACRFEESKKVKFSTYADYRIRRQLSKTYYEFTFKSRASTRTSGPVSTVSIDAPMGIHENSREPLAKFLTRTDQWGGFQEVEDRIDRAGIWRIIEAAPIRPRSRKILRARYFYEWTTKEIASTFGISPANVSRICSEAIQIIRREFVRHGYSKMLMLADHELVRVPTPAMEPEVPMGARAHLVPMHVSQLATGMPIRWRVKNEDRKYYGLCKVIDDRCAWFQFVQMDSKRFVTLCKGDIAELWRVVPIEDED